MMLSDEDEEATGGGLVDGKSDGLTVGADVGPEDSDGCIDGKKTSDGLADGTAVGPKDFEGLIVGATLTEGPIDGD